MAKKLTDASISLLSESEISADDILYTVHDPAGTPASRKITNGMLANKFYKISPTVASNNLTVAIQHLDGSAPSAANPLVFKVGDAWKVIASTASYTKNAGTNWHNAGSAELAAQDIDFFVYAINETGASAGLKFGHSRIPWAVTMGDFVNTTTSEKYIAGNWVNFNSTDSVELIGRFRARLSAAASYNWSIVTSKVINTPVFFTDVLTWSPVWTNLSVGNGVVVAGYQINGRLLKARLRLTWGSTTSITGTGVMISTPFSIPNVASFHPVGIVLIHDAGATIYTGYCQWNGTSQIQAVAQSASGTYAAYAQLQTTVPMTWVATDELMCDFHFEI